MLKKTKFQKSNSEKEWFKWCKSLLELYQTEKQFVATSLHKTSHLGMKRWILGNKLEGSNLILRNMLLDAMISADGISPGAGIYVPWFIYNKNLETPSRKHSDVYFESTIGLAKSNSAKEIFKSVYNTVGPLTKIILKKSYETDTVIKYRNSFRFPLSLDAQFHRMIGNVEYIELTNPIVLMIEGAPETIGEINSLLQWNHENSRPVLLIARSFPEEISATLATNWIRNSLNILPISYGGSIESINLAADISAISKGELISAHFGDVIASSVLNEDKWGSVDKLEWTSSGLSLYKKANVSGHINNLIEKIKSIEEEEIQNMYKERILSLSNDAIEVWIHKEDKQVIEELDAMIMHYNGFIVSGLVETGLGPLPSSFARAAKETSQSLKDKIVNIGGFLVGVNDEVVAR